MWKRRRFQNPSPSRMLQTFLGTKEQGCLQNRLALLHFSLTVNEVSWALFIVRG